MVMNKQLHELSSSELSDLLMITNHQFLEALKNDDPIQDLEILRDYITAIRNEIRLIEGGGHKIVRAQEE